MTLKIFETSDDRINEVIYLHVIHILILNIKSIYINKKSDISRPVSIISAARCLQVCLLTVDFWSSLLKIVRVNIKDQYHECS